MSCYFNLNRGEPLSPLFDKRKNIAPLVGGAIISAAGSVLGSVLNAKSNANNNALQQQLVQDANAYNTPANQMQRFQDAGFNPYMMLGQVNAGNQTSVASTNPTDYSSGIQGVGNAANTLIQAASAGSQIDVNNANVHKAESETNLNLIDAKTREAQNLAQINLLVKEGLLTKQQADNLSQDFDLRAMTWDELIKQPGLSNSLTAEQIANLKSATAKADSEKKAIDLQNGITTNFGSKLAAANLANIYSQIGVNHANVGLMGSQVGLNGTYMDLNRQQVGVLRNQQNSYYWDSQEKKRNYQYNKSKFDKPNLDWHFDKWISPLLNFAGKAGSAYILKK